MEPLDEEDGFYLTKHSKDELTKLFRNIMKERVMSNGSLSLQWEYLMEKYLSDPSNGVPTNGKDRSSARGNMNKALRSGTMSWKIFKIALKFLRARSVRFQLIIDWGPMTDATVHWVTMPILSDSSLGVSSMAKKIFIPTVDPEFDKIPTLSEIVEEQSVDTH